MKLSTRAFSLVELMFFMVVTSVILAAFMPVISRKISHDSSVTTEATIRYNCQKYGEYCSVCHKKGCLLCELECPSGRVKNSDKCVCE